MYFSAEELASAFAASEWKTSWQSQLPGGYNTQKWSEALGSGTLRGSLTTKPLLTKTSPVLAQASLKWLMYCDLEALAKGNSSFFYP